MQMYSDTKLMEQEVTKQIPIGSDIKEAKRIMKQNGFSCAILTNGTFKMNRTFEEADKSGKKTTLLCRKTTTFFVSNMWIVEFTYKNNNVQSFYAYFRSTASDL